MDASIVLYVITFTLLFELLIWRVFPVLKCTVSYFIAFLLESAIKDYSNENIKIYNLIYKRGCPLILTNVALTERLREGEVNYVDKSGIYYFPSFINSM